jgi:hypothetical protein
MLALLACSALAVGDGYHSFKVTSAKPFCVFLATKTLVFALDETPPPTVNFTVIDNKNKTYPVPMSALTHLQLLETTILVTAEKVSSYVLHYWLLPRTLCSSVSYAMIADRSISFDLTTPKFASDFCIFPNSGAASYSWSVASHTTGRSSSIEFYPGGIDAAKTCTSGSCSYSSSKPTFVRISASRDQEFSASIAFTTFRNSIAAQECLIKALPLLIEPPVQVPMSSVSMSDIICFSMSETLLIWMAIGLVAVGILLVSLCLLQAFGVINVWGICLCRTESDHFGSLRENPYASELNPDAA